MDRKKPLSGVRWVLFLLSLPAAVVLLAVYEAGGGTGLVCPFYRLTGLYCPGCGSGRAVRALLEGNLWESFRYNPLLWVLGPPAVVCVIREYLRILFPRLGWKPLDFDRRIEIVFAGLIFGFWLLRNLPGFSFLAPGT